MFVPKDFFISIVLSTQSARSRCNHYLVFQLDLKHVYVLDFTGTDLICVATCEGCPGESVEDDVIG